MNADEEIRIFCENVRILRIRHGLTQMQMAQKLGIFVSELALIEHGIMPNSVTLEVAIRIQKCFGVPLKHQFEAF